MKTHPSFFLCWLPVCWLVLVGASIGVIYQAKRIVSKPQEFISLAKLVTDVPAAGSASSFHEAIIKTLESTELQERARARMKALHPDLAPADVIIKASQNRGASIFNIRAFGVEPKHTRLSLDALLDEFIAMDAADPAALRGSATGGEEITVMERASGAVEELQEWSRPIVLALLAGASAGFMLSVLIAALIHKSLSPADSDAGRC